MIRFKTAKTAEEKQAFIDAYAQRSHNPIEMSYLDQSEVRYAQDESGRMIAGYIVNSKAPLRYFSWFRNQDNSAYFNLRPDESDACEITCIWMDRTSLNLLRRYWVYIQSTLDASKTNKKIVVGGAVVKKVAQIQMKGMPHLIYNGPISWPGNPEGWVYFEYRNKIVMRLLGAIVKELASIATFPIWGLTRALLPSSQKKLKKGET